MGASGSELSQNSLELKRAIATKKREVKKVNLGLASEEAKNGGGCTGMSTFLETKVGKTSETGMPDYIKGLAI